MSAIELKEKIHQQIDLLTDGSSSHLVKNGFGKFSLSCAGI